MRKTFFIMLIMSAFLCLTSCEKEEDAREYSIVSNLDFSVNKLTIFEYNEQGDRIYDHTINGVYKGSSYSFTAFNSYVTKVKIYVKDLDKWVQRVYYLNENKKTIIQLDGNLYVGSKEP